MFDNAKLPTEMQLIQCIYRMCVNRFCEGGSLNYCANSQLEYIYGDLCVQDSTGYFVNCFDKSFFVSFY